MAKFSTKEARKELKPTKRSRLVPGIYDGVYLEEILIGATPNGNQYMDFNFVKKDEDRVSYLRIWFPNGKNTPRDAESQADADQREINGKIAWILTIMECYMTSEECEIDANSFDEFCDKAKAIMNAQDFGDTQLRIKLVPDKELKYSEFPRFPGGAIERVVEGSAPRVHFSKWEKLNRVTPYRLQREAPTSDDTIVNTGTATEDDLPF